jgi:hypothetical protein
VNTTARELTGDEPNAGVDEDSATATRRSAGGRDGAAESQTGDTLVDRLLARAAVPGGAGGTNLPLVRLRSDLHAELGRIRKASGVSTTEMVSHAVETWLSDHRAELDAVLEASESRPVYGRHQPGRSSPRSNGRQQ